MNLRRFLSVKKKILIPLVISVLIAGGFFYWWNYYETPPEKWDEADYSKAEDYVVKETAEGMIVENKKAGLSFEIPEGWTIEKKQYSDYVALFAPDTEGTLMIEKGCKVTIEARYIKTSFLTIEKILRKGHEAWGYIDEYEIIEVDRHKALKNITGIASLNQYGIGIHIPTKSFFKSKSYYFGLSSNLQDKEKCAQEFEQFLKTVLIE